MSIVRVTSLCIAFILLAVSTVAGMMMNYLLLFLFVSTFAMLGTLIVALVKKRVDWRLRSSELRLGRYARRALLRGIGWLIIGASIYIAVIPQQFSKGEYSGIFYTTLGLVLFLCAVEWVPRLGKSKSVDLILFFFAAFLVLQLGKIFFPSSPKNAVILQPPVEGEWLVFHGGNSALINHHYFAGSQKYALDLVIEEDAILPNIRDMGLDDYASYAQKVYAPVSGQIVALSDWLIDQKVGETDRRNIVGNHIIIRTENDEYVLLAHLKQHSAVVQLGEKVEAGQQIAQVGNSGNTSQPHLHIQAMTGIKLLDSENSALPMLFKRGGQPGPIYSYKRNDTFMGL